MTADVPSAFDLLTYLDDDSLLPSLTAREEVELFLKEPDPDQTEVLGPVPHKLRVLMAHAARFKTRHDEAIDHWRSAENSAERATADAEHDRLCTFLHLICPIIGEALENTAKELVEEARGEGVEAYGNYQVVGVTSDWQLVGKEPCQPDVSADLAAFQAGVRGETFSGLEAFIFGDEDAARILMASLRGRGGPGGRRH